MNKQKQIETLERKLNELDTTAEDYEGKRAGILAEIEALKETPKAPERKSKYKSFSEVFGDGEFYPDLPKVPFKECLDHDFVMFEAKILRDFNSEFGKHDCGLMLLAPVDNEDEKFTTICSGIVVLERLEKAIKERRLPMLCTPVYVDNNYYNLK